MQSCFPAPFKPSHRGNTDAESGYVLLAVIFLMVALLISLAIAAPKMAVSIQRDKERETIQRGEQYKRAIQLYYRQFGHYPTSIDQLLNTNQVRFLRKRYTDPLTGKDDWKPVLFGQAHVRPLGFFGQPLTGVAGIGTTSGSMYAASSSTTDANGVPVADSSDNGSNSNAGLGSGPSFGGIAPSSGAGGSGAGSGMFGSSPSSSGLGSNGAGANGIGSTGTGFGSSNGPGGTSATTFGGGGPIVGMTLPVDKPSLIDYKKQTRYNKWEFNYDPVADLNQANTMPTNGPAVGTPTNGAPGMTSPTTSPTTGTPTSPNTDTPTSPQ